MKKIILLLTFCVLLSGCSDTKKYAPKEGRLPVFERATPAKSSGTIALDSPLAVDSWNFTFQNPQNKLPNLALDLSEEKAWRRTLGKKKELKRKTLPAPIADKDSLYLLDGTYTLTKANLETGEEVWQKQIAPNKTGLSVITNGTTLFALSTDGLLTALDAEGNQLWQKDFKVETRAPLIADKKAVYLLTAHNQIIALKTKNGAELWRYQTTKPQTWLTTMASPAKSKDVLVVPFATGEVIGFDADSGLLLWIQMMVGNRPQDLTEVPQITAAPVIDGNTVYLTGNANLSGAFDLRTGETKWTTLFSSPLLPIITKNTLFMITNQNVLTALDKRTGKIFWQKEMATDTDQPWQALLLVNDELVLSNGVLLHFVNPQTGEIIRTQKKNVFTYPLILNRHLITMDQDTKVSYYREEK